VSASQNGNRLRAVAIDDSLVFEHKLNNNGSWGTLPVCCVDLDGDGRDEVLVPTSGHRGNAMLLALNGRGEEVACREVGPCAKDDYGIRVPLLAAFRYAPEGSRGVVAAFAGGTVAAFDGGLRELWRLDGLRHDYGHEFLVGDFDGDGRDEICCCTADHIAAAYEHGGNAGELVLIDHDGRLLLRRRVDDYVPDTHFDDVQIADFMGTGSLQILVEKGILLDLDGRVIWDLSRLLEHGQWIAHAPMEGRGRAIMISELWSASASAVVVSGGGELLWRTSERSVPFAHELAAQWRILATRCHAIAWEQGGPWEFFLGEQSCAPTSHDCFRTVGLDLQGYFFHLDGELCGTLRYADAQVEGNWYNGEVHSAVADVDGDGRPEIVFPKQNGKVMIIKKR
jgi:hypothetical protein